MEVINYEDKYPNLFHLFVCYLSEDQGLSGKSYQEFFNGELIKDAFYYDECINTVIELDALLDEDLSDDEFSQVVVDGFIGRCLNIIKRDLNTDKTSDVLKDIRRQFVETMKTMDREPAP